MLTRRRVVVSNSETMDAKQHWEEVYATTPDTEVAWFQEHADTSVKMIRDTGAPLTARLIDVGGGASRLADDLLDLGYRDLTVLDLSARALEYAKARLGARAERVRWIEADVLRAGLGEASLDVWHDRAVFHFLTEESDRKAYVAQVLRSVRPGGSLIVATFAEDGPDRCSGLPVVRYDSDALQEEFGGAFRLLDHRKESHRTPGGREQSFSYCRFRVGAG